MKKKQKKTHKYKQIHNLCLKNTPFQITKNKTKKKKKKLIESIKDKTKPLKIKYINIPQGKHYKEEHQNSKSSKLLENSKKERGNSETLRIVALSGKIWW